ncbi:hypothetical protein OPV22_007266 [Ensete ventricosum]|uniref:C2H2-type domain-containing protein n=1 Tax=Ensete ventricosum TaxID=4639 RepID=A0AAV8RGX7_ENSVE|nr:hypothetical protein OPV22_007266 [Ensete ventricosum]
MDRHTCNLCFRRFSNGRALGGHMRSHVIAAAPLARPRSHGYSSDSTSSAQPAAERVVEEVEVEKEVGLCYGLRMNPRKSFRLVDPEFSSSTFAAVEAAGSCDVVQDGESETESPRGQRRPTKRPCRATAPPLDQPEGEPVSSVSDATPEEDIALCLMMLSRDSWAATAEDRPLDGSDDEDDRRPATRSRPPPRKGRSRYQCSTCKKVFRSYQALGGHRASHKRTNGCRPVTEPRINSEADSVDVNADADAKVHECPLCFRAFSSGQALGSHKRSHLTSSATTVAGNSPLAAPPPPCSPPSTSPVPVAAKNEGNFGLIDLNLPAPEEDDAELSAVESTQSVPTQPPRRKHAI